MLFYLTQQPPTWETPDMVDTSDSFCCGCKHALDVMLSNKKIIKYVVNREDSVIIFSLNKNIMMILKKFGGDFGA